MFASVLAYVKCGIKDDELRLSVEIQLVAIGWMKISECASFDLCSD